MAEDRFDLIVLGSGTGGYACALRPAELGRKVALVEKDDRLAGRACSGAASRPRPCWRRPRSWITSTPRNTIG